MISAILKDKFCLKYKKIEPALPRYLSPDFDEKRYYVSRFLSHMLIDDALVISIDECHFKTNDFKIRKWTFHPRKEDHVKMLIDHQKMS